MITIDAIKLCYINILRYSKLNIYEFFVLISIYQLKIHRSINLKYKCGIIS